MSSPQQTPSPKRLRVDEESAIKRLASGSGTLCIEKELLGDMDPDLSTERELLGSPDEEGDSEYDELIPRRRWTPNQVRARIQKLLKDTNIKITEFQSMLSVNSNSYNRFMNGKYKSQWNAAENGTYDAALRFFSREEKFGKQSVGKLRANSRTGGCGDALPDISSISTDGLTYHTPGETRREMAKILKKYKTSVAALARLAGVPAQSMNLFYKAGGDFGASENQAYHPAAELVEQIRIACSAPKSKKRLTLEAEVAAGRTSRDGQPFLGINPQAKFLCMAGERPVVGRDSVGRKIVEFRR